MSFMRNPYIWHDDKQIHLPSSSIDLDTFDELVVMRFAEMKKKEITDAEKRAIKKHYGNFGCDSVAKKYKMKTTLDLIKSATKKKGGKNGKE